MHLASITEYSGIKMALNFTGCYLHKPCSIHIFKCVSIKLMLDFSFKTKTSTFVNNL